MYRFWLALQVCVWLLGSTYCYPDGAPVTACHSMLPNHQGRTQQNSRSPYSITAKKSGQSVLVTIEDPDNQTPFKGFLIQAFQENGSIIQNGKFVPWENSKTLNCDDGLENALTHKSGQDKRVVNASWLPPPHFQDGVVIFKATVVMNFNTFWTDQRSEPIYFSSSNLPSTKTNMGTVVPSRSTTTSTAMPSLMAIEGFTDLYSGCGTTKGCFGLPSNCVEKRNCELVLMYEPAPSRAGVHFRLVGALGTRSGWIAAALSRNTKMGEDSVTECAVVNGMIVVRESWNIGPPRRGNVVLSGVKNITDEKGDYEGGVITCEWNKPYETAANGYNFNLLENEFYILLAKGPIDGAGQKLIHNARLSSANPVNLTSVSLVIGKPSTLIKIHGSLMTFAWIGLVSLGILFPRHYKQVWTKYKLCGSKVWFTIHRSLMLVSVGLVIAAFAAIFVDVDGWSNVAPNPHPLLGCLATFLMILQPFIAICRPQPTSPKRPIFQWIHGMVGSGAQLIACINIFFAVSLKESNVPDAFYWVMITFVIFHCTVHLLIHIHSCLMERERERESSSKLHQFQIGDGYEINEDSPGSAFKKFALGLYCLVILGLTTALVLMITLN